MPAKPKPNPEDQQRGRLAERVLSTAGNMVGASATLVGLTKLIEPSRGVSSVDDYAGLTAVVFLISVFLAYVSLRLTHRPSLAALIENVADGLFLLGLAALAVIGVMFAFDVV